MKIQKLVDTLKKGNIVLPMYLFQERDKFGLDMDVLFS